MLKNAPHSAEQVSADNWEHCYSRSEAAYPVEGLRNNCLLYTSDAADE